MHDIRLLVDGHEVVKATTSRWHVSLEREVVKAPSESVWIEYVRGRKVTLTVELDIWPDPEGPSQLVVDHHSLQALGDTLRAEATIRGDTTG